MPADTGSPAAVEMDGGVIDAAAAISAIPGFEEMLADPSPTRAPAHPGDTNRATNGQFRAQPADRNQPAKIVDIRTKAETGIENAADQAADDKMGADEESSTPAEEYFELPPDRDGADPVRIKAEEVFNGYQEAKQLKSRLAELEKGTPPPEVFDQQLMQLVDVQGQTMRQMQVYAQLLKPTEPDLELINEESPRYNPGLFQRQTAMAKHQQAQADRIHADMAAMEADRNQRMSAIQHLQRVRGREALAKLWPEVVTSDGKEAARVRSEVADYYSQYGVTPEVMASITNPGFYAVLKDALAYRRGLKERETAVRVVRSKPKLVRGAARGGDNQRQQAYQSGMQRLSKSNTVEDAAAALTGLI